MLSGCISKNIVRPVSQRFGTKRNLLLAVASQGTSSIDESFASARAAHDSPLDALLSCCADATRFYGTPEELSNHLAFFQIDLTDPDFHRLAVKPSTAP